MDCFSHVDVSFEIFRHLAGGGFVSIPLVCRAWWQAFRSDHLWLRFFTPSERSKRPPNMPLCRLYHLTFLPVHFARSLTEIIYVNRDSLAARQSQPDVLAFAHAFELYGSSAMIYSSQFRLALGHFVSTLCRMVRSLVLFEILSSKALSRVLF
jgi:hypothetical protein